MIFSFLKFDFYTHMFYILTLIIKIIFDIVKKIFYKYIKLKILKLI